MGVIGGAKSIAAQDELVVCIDFINPNCYTDGATTATNIGSATLTATIPAEWGISDGHMLCTTHAGEITSATPNVDVTTGMTYEFWTKGNTTTFGLVEGENGSGTSYVEGIQIHIYSDPGHVYVRGSGLSPAEDSGNVISANTWHHIVVIFEANDSGGAGGSANSIIYVDGALISNGDVANIVVPTNTIKLGDPYSLASDYLDIWRVYHKVLTAAEIMDNYLAQKGRFGL